MYFRKEDFFNCIIIVAWGLFCKEFVKILYIAVL